MYTDTHFHYLEMLKKGWSSDDIRSLFLQGEIRYAIEIGIQGHADFTERKTALEDISSINFTIGYHPSQCAEINPDSVKHHLSGLLQEPRLVAIGECGMDFHWDFGSEQEQADLFVAQILLANMHSLPIIVHNRNASKEIIRVLERCPPIAGGVMHCFDSDQNTASRFLDLGMHISFAGNLTFKRNRELREVCAYIPDERLLLETDSPYLTPEPHRGKANTPSFIEYIYACAASQRNCHKEALCDLVYANSVRLFQKNQ